jgi:hypothetical protein
VGSVDEGLRQIELAAVAKVSGERLEYFHERSLRYPLLHPSMTRLIGRVFARQCFPRSAGPQNPKHSVQDAARRNTRTPFAVSPTLYHGDQRLDGGPLLVGEFHSNV